MVYIRIILFFASLVGAFKTPGCGKIWSIKRGRLLYIQNTVVYSVKRESHDLLVMEK